MSDPMAVPDLHCLPSLAWVEHRLLPNCAAIYFMLSAAGDVLHIGQTRVLAHRITGHHRRRLFAAHHGLRIAWMVCDDPALLPAIEAACITHFAPAMNTGTMGRRNTPSADFISWPTRFPPDMLSRLKAIADIERRPINWQIVLFLEDALEAYDHRDGADPTRRTYAEVV